MTLICAEHGIPRKSFTDDAMEALKLINWTGNIRELRNIVERLIILGGQSISSQEVQMFANPTR
jgi:DNA-binding NtrC family response regulator